MINILLLIFLFIHPPLSYAENSKPKLTLAKTYKGQVDLSQYWVSEKLDGVRAYWDGKQLVSRQGNIFPAPAWFVKKFPETALDGELWLARGKFQKLLSIVSKKVAIEEEWQEIAYYVFDLPNSSKLFSQRLNIFRRLVNQTNSQYLRAIEQYRIVNHSELMLQLNNIVELGGEGLMLHRTDAVYKKGRTRDLLKVKPYYDAEAIVVAHTQGKGKFLGMLGAILVKTPEGQQFRIGTGFSLEQRRFPPPIGTIITYTYHGKTDRGIPRFASFLRVRRKSTE